MMRINVHYKITITFVIIIAFVFSCTYFYLNNSLKANIYQFIEKNLLKKTIMARSILEKRFAYSPPVKSDKMDIMADELGKILDLQVTIIDLKGNVLGDSELNDTQLSLVENHLLKPEIQQALESGRGESRRFSATIKKDMLYIASVVGADSPIALVRLSIPLSEVELISNSLKNLLLISFVFAFLSSIIISFAASIFISRPIKEISSFANSIAGGDFSKNISINAEDEIGDLARSFQFMVKQIRLRIEEVIINKSRFEAVLLSMFEGVMVVDMDGTILLMNKRLRDFLLVKGNPNGKRPLEVIRNSATQELVDQSLKKGHKIEHVEITVFLPEEKNLLVNTAPIVMDGKKGGAVFVFHDITKLKYLERVRRNFVANVSHELRTPITNIKGYAETLLDGALNDKKNLYNFLKIIYSDSGRMSLLIDDLLDLTRIESGKLQLSFKPCNIKDIVVRLLSMFKKQALKRAITVSIDIPDELPNILADEMKITQVLQNLIDNAIKYNRDSGSVAISAMEIDGSIQIEVSDTGYGIPENDITRIFERFYRVDKARSRELGGTGLGLSIVKHIVNAHNGDVFVNSTVGAGSTFIVSIPNPGQAGTKQVMPTRM